MFGQSQGLKWYPRKKLWSMSTGNNWFCQDKMQAESFNWWTYFYVIKGKNVFNDYSYSVSTSAHQRYLKACLKELGIKIDVFVYQRESLLSYGQPYINIEQYYEKIFELEIEIARPRSQKAKNEERKESIEWNKNKIKELRKLGAKFSNKQKAELKKEVKKREQYRLDNLVSKKKEPLSIHQST